MTIRILLLLIVSVPTIVTGQDGSFAGAPFRVGHSPYGRAMGNALTASDNALFAYHNPATASLANQRSVEMARSVMAFDRSISTFTLASPLPPSAGLALGIIFSQVDGFDGRTVSGYPTGSFGIYEAQFFTAFGIRIGPKTQIGAGIKISLADYNSSVTAATAVGLDLGLRRQLSDRSVLAISVQDLVAAYTWNTQELYGTVGANQTVDAFPTRLRAGYLRHLPGWNLTVSMEAERQIQAATYDHVTTGASTGGRPVRRTVDIRTTRDMARAGFEWRAHSLVHLRAGYDSQDKWAVGIGLPLPVDRYFPSIDYTVLSEHPGLPLTHQLALRIRL